MIEFQQILYGYYQLNPLYGPSYILDVLLTFKKYRGKKMTVPVRKHAYVQQQFTSKSQFLKLGIAQPLKKYLQIIFKIKTLGSYF